VEAVRSDPVILAQVTDTHISVGDHGPGRAYWAENERRLRTAIRALNAETAHPTLVIATGDLVECGSESAYEVLMDILQDLQLPFWPIPGNHDSNARLRTYFPDMPWTDGHSSWAQLVPGTNVTVIGFDSTLRGSSGGHVDRERLDWLADQIEAASGPTIVAMHHPPFLTGIDWMDGLGFNGLEELQQLFIEHSPTRVIAGHIHRSITSQVGPTMATVGVATAPHIHLDLSNASIPAVINDPIGYQLHCVFDDDGPKVISHTRFIDRASIPRPIRLPD
jgi:3',5'-cyclic AMP phosphodiesterase CpdA